MKLAGFVSVSVSFGDRLVGMRSRASGVARLRRIFSAATFFTLAHFSDVPCRTRGSASLPPHARETIPIIGWKVGGLA